MYYCYVEPRRNQYLKKSEFSRIPEFCRLKWAKIPSRIFPHEQFLLHVAEIWREISKIGGREGGENGGKRVEGKELSDKKKEVR